MNCRIKNVWDADSDAADVHVHVSLKIPWWSEWKISRSVRMPNFADLWRRSGFLPNAYIY
jgi:hypothetical protein